MQTEYRIVFDDEGAYPVYGLLSGDCTGIKIFQYIIQFIVFHVFYLSDCFFGVYINKQFPCHVDEISVLTKKRLVYYLTCPYVNASIATSFGDLAQLVEHTAHIRDVNGSIPLVAKAGIRTYLKCRIFFS